MAILADIRSAIAQADYLAAYALCDDLTEEQRKELDPVVALRVDFYQCLALTRGGSGKAARQSVRDLHQQAAGIDLPADLAEDIASLDARLAKDEALRLRGDERRAAAATAGRLYEAVFAHHGRPYACVNAATMFAIAGGDTYRKQAEELARKTLLVANENTLPEPGTDLADAARYWDAATRAEALALLGDIDAMKLSIADAAERVPHNRSARSATVGQLSTLFDELGIDVGLLEPLRNPPVLHYCGHRISNDLDVGRFPLSALDRVTADIDAWFDSRSFSRAFGSLASGADILVAEACIARGIDLDVVLPFSAAEFAETSVADSGADWVERFWRCLDAAARVGLACDCEYLGDDVLYGYAANLAMGGARNRARSLGTEAVQLAIWDGGESPGDAGTAHDIEVWRSVGGTVEVIDSMGAGTTDSFVGVGQLSRQIRAVVFGDLKGYSRLGDLDIQAFQAKVMAPLSEVLRNAGDGVLVAQTWGDGLKVIFSDVAVAATAALDIQSALAGVDLEAAGLPADFGLRLSGHVGPLLPIVDAISGEEDFAGREMTRAARIEPRTPEGEVYVTGAFAALLALQRDTGVSSEYMGTITTARDFETIPVYALTRDIR